MYMLVRRIRVKHSFLPLQAPKRALFASGAAMAVAAWRWRVVDKHARSHRVQVEAEDLPQETNEVLKPEPSRK
jgi:hypothetical protein